MSNITGIRPDAHNTIEIYSFTYDKKVSFLAFLTDFKDTFSSAWNPTEVYGRMDPVVTFKNTKRNISLAFDVPNINATQAALSSKNVDFIINGMYPTYGSRGKASEAKGTSLLASPPLFRVKFSNLISNRSPNPRPGEGQKLSEGLLGYLTSFDFSPDIESGFFVDANGSLYPKLLKVSLGLNVIHEHPLGNENIDGYDTRVNFSDTFPHGYPDNPPTDKTQPNAAGGSNNSTQDSLVRRQLDTLGQKL